MEMNGDAMQQMKRKHELLVSGYVSMLEIAMKKQNKNIIIPAAIIKLCFAYYHQVIHRLHALNNSHAKINSLLKTFCHRIDWFLLRCGT